MAISADKTKLYTEDGKGITLDEIAACLKDYRVTALGRDLGLLATSPNIKWQSKFKPVTHSTWGDLFANNPAGYRGANNDCNIQTTMINYSDITGYNVASIIKNATGPSYIKVTSTPKRMLDFDGYNHAALSPMSEFAFPPVLYSNLSTNVYMPSGNYGAINDYGQNVLTLGDLMRRFNNYSSIPTTSMGIVGLIAVMTFGGYEYTFFASISLGGTTQTNIDINPKELATLAGFTVSAGQSILLAPCIANTDTGGEWIVAQSNNSLQFILWDTALGDGAYKEYQLEEYVDTKPWYSLTATWSSDAYYFGSGVNVELTVTMKQLTTLPSNNRSYMPSCDIYMYIPTFNTGSSVAGKTLKVFNIWSRNDSSVTETTSGGLKTWTKKIQYSGSQLWTGTSTTPHIKGSHGILMTKATCKDNANAEIAGVRVNFVGDTLAFVVS